MEFGTAMDTCASCGGPLSADLQWCPRCLTPIERRQPVATPPGHRMPPRNPPPVAVYSRWRAGPTSFGAAGRMTLSLLVLLGAVAGYPMSRGEMLVWIGFDVPGTAFLVAYGVVAGATVAYLLTRIWRRARIA
jgi:hypothetical protein